MQVTISRLLYNYETFILFSERETLCLCNDFFSKIVDGVVLSTSTEIIPFRNVFF